jgi:hypothetical protein
LWLPPAAQAMANKRAKNILNIFLNFKMNKAGARQPYGGRSVTVQAALLAFFWEVVWAQIAGALLASQARYYPRFHCPFVKFTKQMYSGVKR